MFSGLMASSADWTLSQTEKWTTFRRLANRRQNGLRLTVFQITASISGSPQMWPDQIVSKVASGSGGEKLIGMKEELQLQSLAKADMSSTAKRNVRLDAREKVLIIKVTWYWDMSPGKVVE